MEFGLSIQYCKANKGYFLSEDETDFEDGNELFSLLELAENISDILHSYKDFSQNKRHIRFSTSGPFKGSEFFPILNEAIKSSRWVSFKYKAYSSEKHGQRKLIPLFLFEFRHRWYLLGREKGIIKTFGLDRIEEPALIPQFFDQREETIDFQEYFRHTLGVSWYDHPPVEILLSFHPKQAPYLKALPIHSSQLIIQDSQKAFVISLRLIINYELKQELLSYGSRVKVLAPAELAKEIKAELQKAIKQYEK